MDIVSGRTITGESLRLDNTHFIDCKLHDCQLNYSGGTVAFERTMLSHCHYVFYGRARSTVVFLQRVGLLPSNAGDWAELTDVVN